MHNVYTDENEKKLLERNKIGNPWLLGGYCGERKKAFDPIEYSFKHSDN